jgi:CRISPR-associated protein (TIGR02710 family)
MQSNPILLVVTVGNLEPLAAVLRARGYSQVCYICSQQSRASLDSAPFPATLENTFVLPDPEDFRSVVERIRRDVAPVVAAWQAAFPDGEVVVDFTGGTKCMTAAAALVARRWKCRFQYIGGERAGSPVGVVLSGKEKALVSPNPWTALGYQAAEQAITIFDGGSPAAARLFLEEPIHRAEAEVRQALTALHKVFTGYAEWDRFDHAAAREAFASALEVLPHLEPIFSPAAVLRLRAVMDRDAAYLGKLLAAEKGGEYLVLDLIANAYRRMHERRHDDAVARLYRATEALAQVRLRADHGVEDTESVPAASVPEQHYGAFSRGVRKGRLYLTGLHDSYRLLRIWDNPAGARFQESVLSGNKSPLRARNKSILAHGYKPLEFHSADELLVAVLELAGVHIRDLPMFPKFHEIA